MLYSYILSYRYVMFVQSGLYFDFFFKKLGEVFLKNVMVLTPQFFGEKYFIEVLTKKIIENTIFIFNKFVGFTTLSYFNFFFLFFVVLFNSISLLSFLFLFL